MNLLSFPHHSLSLTPHPYTFSIVRRSFTTTIIPSTATSLLSSSSNLLRPLSLLRSQIVSLRPLHLPHISFSDDLLRDSGSTIIALAGAYGLVFVFDNLTQRSVIQQGLSRKLVHILSGLLFLISWPIFSNAMEARFFASLVPCVNFIRLLVHGLSLATDEGLVKSVTREGNPEELLKGPLFYTLILILCTLAFWRESPLGLISVSMMCGGDGIADIMGRKFGYVKIPYNHSKSWAGSISMFIFGLLVSIGMLYYYSSVLGYLHLDWTWTAQRVAVVALVATVVESLPITNIIDDNISVPLASMIAAFMYFR